MKYYELTCTAYLKMDLAFEKSFEILRYSQNILLFLWQEVDLKIFTNN